MQTQRTRAPTTLVAAAFVMTLSSAFGQTYFIGLFAPWLKQELGLTDGSFGTLYMVATLASAAVLMWAGRIADLFRIRRLAVIVLVGLAATAVAMSFAPSAMLLLPVLFGLRLFGQGFLGHLAMTGVGRWYVRRRGRMMSVAVLGFPASEAVMPFAAVALIGAVGWRETWQIVAGFLCLVSVPLVLFFLRREPSPGEAAEAADSPAAPRRDWSRADVLRRPVFYALLAGIVTPPFIVTGILFHQTTLVATKGWTLAWFTAWFPVYALASVATALVAGALIDRFTARQLLPFYLLPLAVGVTALAVTDSLYAAPVFMALAAVTNGAAQTLIGALWAELFGVRHLGAIRSVAFAAVVFSTALAPAIMGVLLDAGVRLEAQYLAMAAYTVFATGLLWSLRPSLDRIVATSTS
ncbi:MFS family permease [Amorphus suaedae]